MSAERLELYRRAADLMSLVRWYRRKRLFARAYEAESRALALSRKANWLGGSR